MDANLNKWMRKKEIQDMAEEHGWPLIKFVFDYVSRYAGSCNNTDVKQVFDEAYVGYFDNAREAGYALMDFTYPDLLTGIDDFDITMDFEASYEFARHKGEVHHVENKDGDGFWVFLASKMPQVTPK